MGRYMKYALIILGVILVVLAVLLYLQYRTLRHEQFLSARQHWFDVFIRHHGPLLPQDADLIRPWMTFDYINKIFNLPPGYLQSRLAITDPRYPKLSISGLVKDDQGNGAAILDAVVSAVRNYQPPKLTQ